MSKWSRFYENRMTPLYRSNLKRKYQPFLNIIANCNPQYLVEAGCGAGHITRLLADVLPNSSFLCVDRDLQMLTLAQNNLAEVQAPRRISLRREDITARGIGHKLRRVSHDKGSLVIHSHGVLEHFNDGQIRQAIGGMLRTSSNLVHCVPSSKYKNKSYGDERLLSATAWGRIANPKRIVEFNDGYDLALIWQ